MTKERLLQTLETMTHAARHRTMANLGRQSVAPGSPTPEAESILQALSAGNGYERRLALQAAWGSRDATAAEHALHDPSRLVRRTATRLLALLADDAQLQRVLATLAPKPLRTALLHLRRYGRHPIIDRHLAALADRNDPAIATLLHLGSTAFVSSRLPALKDAGLDWQAIARAHPQAAAASLTAAAHQAATPDARLAAQIRSILPTVGDKAPDAALALIHAIAGHIPLETLPLASLARRRPDAVATLCLTHLERLPHLERPRLERQPSFVPVAHRLGEPLLLALLERFGSIGPGTPATWLRTLPPSRRAAVYRIIGLSWRDPNGALPAATLTLLPRTEREAEARRCLDLPGLQAHPLFRFPYAALLPWEEARTLLDPFIGDPDPDLRAAALRALSACVRFDRPRAATLVALLLDRRHEQDPVRGTLLAGLADLPPSTWHAHLLQPLAQAFRHALDAQDLSATTSQAIERLVTALLPFHSAWASHWLATIARERGVVGTAWLTQRLAERDTPELQPALTPVLQEWAARERSAPLLAFARTLDRRLPAWPTLGHLLAATLHTAPDTSTVRTALNLLYRRDRTRFATVVPALLDQDPTWIHLAPIQAFLHRHRQDLLTPFLGRTAHQGRFATGDTYLLLPYPGGFHRWTARQQSTFEDSLSGLVDDEARDSPAIRGAIAQWAAMPEAGLAPLIRQAAPENPRPAAREAALRGLGRRDAGDGLPTLLAALDDARARIAIYALRQALLEIPEARALSLLRATPRRRVTVAKEIIRLAGELNADDAHAWLLSLDGEDLHRDVRVALLRALWTRLDDDATWPILERAATALDPALAVAVARVPLPGLSRDRAERLAALIASLLTHPDLRVRMAALARCATEPLPDRRETLLDSLLALLPSPSPEETRLAATAVFATYIGHRAAHVGQAAARVMPDRAAAGIFVHALMGWARQDRERRAPTVMAVVDAFATDPVLAGYAAFLAAATLPGAAAAAYLTKNADQLDSDTIAGIASALESPFESPDRRMTIEAALSASPDASLRRLALAALRGQAAAARGWTAPRLERLEAFRADPSPWIARVAQFTTPPGEPATPKNLR